MATFLRVVALLVALGNYYVFLVNAVLYGSEGVELTEAALEPVPWCAHPRSLRAHFSPLRSSTAKGPLLRANVLVRYLTLGVGMGLGGLLAGSALTVVGAVLIPPLEGTFDEIGGPGGIVVRALEIPPWGLLYGGVVGLLEGVILALPLAVGLGLLRSRTQS